MHVSDEKYGFCALELHTLLKGALAMSSNVFIVVIIFPSQQLKLFWHTGVTSVSMILSELSGGKIMLYSIELGQFHHASILP